MRLLLLETLVVGALLAFAVGRTYAAIVSGRVFHVFTWLAERRRWRRTKVPRAVARVRPAAGP